MMEMRREFSDRDELRAYLAEQFPDAFASDSPSNLSAAAPRHKNDSAGIDPLAYRATRNELTGAVTQLSPYIRHGVLTLSEVKAEVVRRGIKLGSVSKLLQELTWRDYYQRVWAEIGDGIWHDREPYKTGFAATEYHRELPHEIADGTTGMRCIDAFSRDLRETGYLHNHVRMWTAAYVVHARRVRWQAGAKWFLQHLLDGDPAANNLSWQWIAKHVFAQALHLQPGELQRLTNNRYCSDCPLLGHCTFEGSYGEVSARWFPKLGEIDA